MVHVVIDLKSQVALRIVGNNIRNGNQARPPSSSSGIAPCPVAFALAFIVKTKQVLDLVARSIPVCHCRIEIHNAILSSYWRHDRQTLTCLAVDGIYFVGEGGRWDIIASFSVSLLEFFIVDRCALVVRCHNPSWWKQCHRVI